jgi:hypothetical protein
VPQVPDRGQPFHVATLHRLELNRHRRQRHQLSRLPIAGELDVAGPVAVRPAQPARLAGPRRGREELRLQVFALPREQGAGVARLSLPHPAVQRAGEQK